MCLSIVANVMQRKIRPLHPGSVIIDVLEDRGITVNDYYRSCPILREIVEGKRPITYAFAIELQDQFAIKAELLMNLQRKVDIWDSLLERPESN